MAFSLQSLLPTTAEAEEELGPSLGERIVTIAAATLGVLVVAGIAVLMGMA